jgi:hypothetical protein
MPLRSGDRHAPKAVCGIDDPRGSGVPPMAIAWNRNF